MKPSLAHSLPSRLKQWWHDHKRIDAAIILFLLTVLLAAIAYLIWGDDPWRKQLPQKFLAGEHIDNRGGIVLGLWFAAVVNALIATTLLLSSRWWPERNHVPPPKTPGATSPTPLWSRRLFLIGLGAALLAAAWIRAPRLEHSFWNDEEMAFRKFLWGENVVSDSGELKHKNVSWQRTLFYTANGNNHVTQTVTSRISHETWKRFFRQAGDRPFQESVIRLPPFINSLLGIAALAFLLRVTGYPLAGVTAAWLLALNPWHLRYSVEARGYADLMLLIPLTFIALIFALRSGKWRWWLLYGLLQSLYLLAFAGSVYLAAAQNLIVLALLLKRGNTGSIWKWGVSTAIGAMLFIQIMIPMAIRVIDYNKAHQQVMAPITLGHLQDLWAHLVIGAPWKTMADPASNNGFSVQMYQAEQPGILLLMIFFIPLLLLIGLLTAIIKSTELRLFIGSTFGALALLALHNSLTETIFLIWYVVYTVLIFALALAFIPELLTTNERNIGKNQGGKKWSSPSLVCALLLIVSYGLFTAPSLCRLRHFEREPMRAAVEFVRGEAPALKLENKNQLTCSIGSGAVQMRSYDPWVHPVKTQADFDLAVKEARDSGKTLSIYACSPLRVEREFPEAWKTLENPQVFEKTVYLKGLEEFWSYQLYRLKTP